MSLPPLQRFWTAADLAGDPQPIDWLIDGVIPSGLFGMCFGEPYAGKSLLGLDWACSVASGKAWLGRQVKPGVVFYVAGEGQSGMGRRIRAWCDKNGVAPDELKLCVSMDATNFLDPASFGELHRKISRVWDQEDIALIVIDTLARAIPGANEDRAEEVMPFVDACAKLQSDFDATVLVLHHTGHGDKTRAKGSIALKGAVDFEYGIARTSTEGVVTLKCTKLKDGELPADRHLRIAPVAMSAVLVECEQPPARASKAPRFKPRANDVLFAKALGTEPQDDATVRAAFVTAHPAGKGDAAKNYLRAKRRALGRGWFAQDIDHRLAPILEAIERDGACGQSL